MATTTWLVPLSCWRGHRARRGPLRFARKGHLAVLDDPHAAPLVIAAPTRRTFSRTGRRGRRRLGCCRHGFGARLCHRDRGCGSVGRFGSCRVLAGSPGRSGRSWMGTAPGWSGAATRRRWSSGRWSRWWSWPHQRSAWGPALILRRLPDARPGAGGHAGV